MNAEWALYQNVLSPEECDLVIQQCLQKELHEAQVGCLGIANKVDSHRKSKTNFMYYDDNTQWLFKKLCEKASEANAEYFKFDITNISNLQFTEYDESYQGEFKKHIDVFWINNDPHYHRKLTLILQLSDPETYEGGDFQFYGVHNYPNPSYLRQRGTVFIFPCFLEHVVMPVTKGTRYSLAGWIEGPKWK